MEGNPVVPTSRCGDSVSCTLATSLVVTVTVVATASARAADDILWNYGPDTGVVGGCWTNSSGNQNFADRVLFDENVLLTGIDVWTCNASPPRGMQIKILADDGAGNPGEFLHTLWLDPTSYTPDGDRYRASFDFDAIALDADTPYWIGVAGDNYDLGQISVLTPGDGRMAQFNFRTFTDHAGVGDQMFRLRGYASRLTLSGSCPGQVTATVHSATPGGVALLLFAFGRGELVIPPPNPCAGTQLGLNATARFVAAEGVDEEGRTVLIGNAPARACGGFLQVLQTPQCIASNVAEMP